MKKALPILIIVAVVFAACQSRPTTASDNTASGMQVRFADTSGLAQFQAWKANNELRPVNEYNQPGTVTQTVKHYHYYIPVRKTPTSRSRSNYSGSMNSESGHTAKVVRRRGWSKAAKGTAIGAGGGAILGAVINKRNPLVGGIIGGILGGGAGYGIGHSMDKKDGRY